MNMNELNKLPDYISVDECRHYFQDVLKSFEEKSNSSAGGELYSQNRENKKSFGAIYPPKDFF